MEQIFYLHRKNIDGVAFAVERYTGKVFRIDGRSLGKWVEISDPDQLSRLGFYGSEITESEAMQKADELEADLSGLEAKAVKRQPAWLV